MPVFERDDLALLLLLGYLFGHLFLRMLVCRVADGRAGHILVGA